MNESSKSRWLLRLENFGKALEQLNLACDQDAYTNLERSGLVKTFELTFELSWNTLKDLLTYEGYDARSPRAIFRTAFEAGYLNADETEIYLEALDKRNLLTHTYNVSMAVDAERLIKDRYVAVLRMTYKRLLERKES